MSVEKVEKAKATKVNGEVYVSSSGAHFVAPKYTVEAITKYKKNIYAKGLVLKQEHLIFGKPFWLEVLNAKGEQDPEIAKDMMTMCNAKEVALWSKIRMAWTDIFWYGPAMSNEFWNYDENNRYSLLELRHLPAGSFDVAPSGAPLDIYSELLQGIVRRETGKIEFWQTAKANGKPEQVTNVTMITEPTSTELAGSPAFLPMMPVIGMIKFVWDTQIQQANRTGAKILFVKVTNPLGASPENGNVSDMDHAKNILANWGKNTAFPLRGNMEIIDPKISDDSNNLEIIAALNQMLIDYISPINFLESGSDSARLGGSDTQRMYLILRWIESVHDWLEEAYSYMLQRYLVANRYDGYTVRLHIPTPEIDTAETDIKRADSGTKNKVLFPNEVRGLLGHEELSEEKLAELAEYYKQNPPDIAQFSLKTVSEDDKSDINPIQSAFENMGKRLAAGSIEAVLNEEK